MALGLTPQTVTIANGTALSPAVGLYPFALHGILMPAAWTAADLTFQVSVDGATFGEMTDVSGNAVDYKAAAGVYIPIDPTLWRAIGLIKVRSGTAGVPVAQAADRVLTLMTRAIA
jgi:hypothetical protein